MRNAVILFGMLGLAACEVPAPIEGPEIPEGREMEVAVGRGGDRAKVVVRALDGAGLTQADMVRARAKAKAAACEEGRIAYEDKADLVGGEATFDFFCPQISDSDEVVVLPA